MLAAKSFSSIMVKSFFQKKINAERINIVRIKKEFYF